MVSGSGWMDFSKKEMENMLRESLSNDDQLLVHMWATGLPKPFSMQWTLRAARLSGQLVGYASSTGTESRLSWLPAQRNWA
jgi:hypothetical protein